MSANCLKRQNTNVLLKYALIWSILSCEKKNNYLSKGIYEFNPITFYSNLVNFFLITRYFKRIDFTKNV